MNLVTGVSAIATAGSFALVVLGLVARDPAILIASLVIGSVAVRPLAKAQYRAAKERSALWDRPPTAGDIWDIALEEEVEKDHAGDLKLLGRVMSQARPYWRHLGGIFVLELISMPLLLLSPIPVKIALDSVAVGSEPLPGFIAAIVPSWAVGSWLGILLVAAALQIAVVLLIQLQLLGSSVARAYVGEKLTLGFRARLFRHSQRLSLAFHDTRGTADSIYRIQYDSPSINYITIDGIIPALTSGITVLAAIYVTARLDWQLALVAVGVCPPLLLLSQRYRERIRPRYSHVKGLESNALKIVQEVLTSVRVVKAFGREDSEQERFVRHSSESVRERIRLAFAEGWLGLVMNLTTAVGTALVLLLGVRSVRAGTLQVGELYIVIAYLSQLYGPLRTVGRKFASMQSQMASAQRAFELMDELPEVIERPNARSLVRATGAIDFKGVSFEYETESPVLKDVSFSVEPGARVGLAGRTGAGKTTLMSLLTRFYDPTVGEIHLDGVDLRDFKIAELRNQFSLFLQDPVLFSTTIGENILYARPGASFEDVIAAARVADVDRFVADLPEGYETIVGERGMRLSGGERQRIALARAFLRDAPILILDEPTSSVDVKTEAAIMEAMERLMKGRTTLMIAHRLSTLDHCEAVVEIEHGSIVDIHEVGSKGGRARVQKEVAHSGAR